MKLQDKVAIITGAGAGMGKAIALLYAAEGAKVVAADINQANLEAVTAQIKAAGGEATGVIVNVSSEQDINKMIDTAIEKYGKLDVLVNNAGIMDNFIPVADQSNEQWERVLSINVNGPFYACRAATKLMLAQGSGVIVNLASVGGLFGARGGAAYVTSKHAIIGLTKSIAATYGTKGIRANAIAPGGVNTDISSSITAPSPIGLEAISRAGQGPMGEADEIARVALFLASSDSSFVNGAVIVADGGWTAH